jgi:hypothetical protein
MLLRDDGSFSIGACDSITQKIYINDTLNSDLFKRVLCHEIVHAAMFSYNVILDIDEEEVIANIIAKYGEEIIKITNSLFTKLK